MPYEYFDSKVISPVYNTGLYGIQCSLARIEADRQYLATLLREQKDKPKRSPYEDKAGRWFG